MSKVAHFSTAYICKFQRQIVFDPMIGLQTDVNSLAYLLSMDSDRFGRSLLPGPSDKIILRDTVLSLNGFLQPNLNCGVRNVVSNQFL